MKILRFPYRKSFTLIELTITIGLLALALTATGGVLISVVKSFQKQAQIQRIERNGDLVTRVISEKIRKAKNVEYITGQNQDDGKSINYLQIYNVDASGNDQVEHIGFYSPGAGETCNDNGFVFSYINPAPTIPGVPQNVNLDQDQYKITGDSMDGVNIINLVAQISVGTPIEVSVTIDVESSKCGTLGSKIQKRFSSFATARASY